MLSRQQFAAFKEWLESDWRGNAKRADPTPDPTTAAAGHAPVHSKPALGSLCHRAALQLEAPSPYIGTETSAKPAQNSETGRDQESDQHKTSTKQRNRQRPAETSTKPLKLRNSS